MVAIMQLPAVNTYQVLAEAVRDASRVELYARQATTSTSSTPASTSSTSSTSGPSSSPLLFFVALGFGVVFTNLWIIVGVKYCFRYNARNRALRNGEDPDQINMENMPARPHRRRKEKKLMTMDEVNERFPLTKYKTWVANRLSAGLPTAGGVNAPSSRPGSVRDVDLTVPSSPVDTKHSINTRPASTTSDAVVANDAGVDKEQQIGQPIVVEPPITDKTVVEKDKTAPGFKPEDSTAAPIGKHVSSGSIDDDDDEDDHIHTAVPPELLAHPGDTCAICIDTLEDDDDIRGLTCGHAFHAGCLDPWLTSRRACCPLCKADYFTPKPRPEGEQIDLTDRAARRREARMNLPQQPRSAWAGFRGASRLMLTRQETAAARADAERDAQRDEAERQRAERRRRRRAAAAAAAAAENNESVQGQQSTVSEPTPSTTTPEATQPAPSRFRNPFSSLFGRNRTAETPAAQAEPSPSQLEAGSTPAAR